jgi:thiosulfate/3-mercaptopyruvate sulfurtransferase
VTAWLAAGHGLSTAIPDVEAGDFTVRPGGMPVLDTRGVLRFAAEGVLLDARAAERYRGDSEPIDPVAGHIPGARSAPTAENLDVAGRMLSIAGLRMRFAGVGVRPEVAVAAYCGSGVTAAHEVLALEVAGISAALYPGSWSEWISDPSHPVATGPDIVESAPG